MRQNTDRVIVITLNIYLYNLKAVSIQSPTFSNLLFFFEVLTLQITFTSHLNQFPFSKEHFNHKHAFLKISAKHMCLTTSFFFFYHKLDIKYFVSQSKTVPQKSTHFEREEKGSIYDPQRKQ